MSHTLRLVPLFLLVWTLSGCVRPVLEPEVPAGPSVRVGLLVDTTDVALQAEAGLRLLDPESGEEIAVFPGGMVRIESDDRGTLTYGTGGELASSGRARLTVRPLEGELISIGDGIYRGGALLLAREGGRLTAINQVAMEAYLLGVVPKEIGPVGEDLLETAKAQAVAARTYAIRYLGRREEQGFDVYATVQDQVYGGTEVEHGVVSRAVRATAGEILTIDGEPIEAFYHSTCAGATAAIHEVWPASPVRSYLLPVSDLNPATGEAFCDFSNRYHWTQEWTVEAFHDILNRTLADSLESGMTSVGRLLNLHVRRRTPSGRVDTLAIHTSEKTFLVGGDRTRWVLETPGGAILNSSRFDISIMRDEEGRPDRIVATGGGWGHGIGMCQVGAMGRARAGEDYRNILRTYYSGARIQDLY